MSNSSRRRKDRLVTVHLLDTTTLDIPIQIKTRYGDILIKVRKHLNLSSSNVFGLAYKTDHGDFTFLDPLAKVWKRERTTSQRAGSPDATRPIHLRVQYYVEAGHHFRADTDRQYYYLQLKENFLRYGFNYPDDRCFLLASYAIHSDRTNWREFDPRAYFPAWVLKSYGTQFIKKHMPTIKPDKMSPSQAMSTYISELASPSPYSYNMTLYKLQNCKTKGSNVVRLGICHEGLEIYEVDSRGYLNFLHCCTWTQLHAIQAVKRKLVVVSTNNKSLEFYTYSEDWCRELRTLIKNAQCTYLGIKTGPTTPLEEQFAELDGLSYREAYIYSDEHDLEWECEQSVMGTLRSTPSGNCTSELVSADDFSLSDAYVSANDSKFGVPPVSSQSRFSIISTTSSTTTSGIVSDRTCLSTEVSQEDLISTNTRPSSCDSLLDSDYDSSSHVRLATVQRAISEPSKNFEHLRFQVRRSPKSLPRRALSDETIDEHDYENIAVVRRVLGMNPVPVKKQQNSFHGQTVHSAVSNSKWVDAPSPYSSMSQPTIPLPIDRYGQSSLSGPAQFTPPMARSPSPYQNRYSLISTSPSMEKLLMDYTPPPSYNETHARQRDRYLAASRQVSEDSTSSLSSSLLYPSSPVRSSTPILNKPTHQKAPALTRHRAELPGTALPQASQKENQQLENSRNCCSCLESPHPEIDKLRNEVKNDLVSLPMISALCNDKLLLQSTKHCTCTDKSPSPRPTSWHCETSPAFSFPPASMNDKQVIAQACH